MPTHLSLPVSAHSPQDVRLEALKLPGCRVQLHRDAHTLLDNHFFVSGQIPRRNDFETGLPSHVTLTRPSDPSGANQQGGGEGGSGGGSRAGGVSSGRLLSSSGTAEGPLGNGGGTRGGRARNPLPRGDWVKDPMLNDERYVAVRIKGTGVSAPGHRVQCQVRVSSRDIWIHRSK